MVGAGKQHPNDAHGGLESEDSAGGPRPSSPAPGRGERTAEEALSNLLFSYWLPGQVPSGSKYGAYLKKGGGWAPKKRDGPFARYSARLAGTKDSTGWLEVNLPKGAPFDCPVRVHCYYLWEHRGKRDEPARGDTISHVLEKSGVVLDDKHLRFVWHYLGHRPRKGADVAGVYLVGYREEAVCRGPGATSFPIPRDEADPRAIYLGLDGHVPGPED